MDDFRVSQALGPGRLAERVVFVTAPPENHSATLQNQAVDMKKF
jgi:hypothetical protein